MSDWILTLVLLASPASFTGTTSGQYESTVLIYKEASQIECQKKASKIIDDRVKKETVDSELGRKLKVFYRCDKKGLK